MSKKFEQIRYWYAVDMWSKEKVKNAVGRLITAEEYKEITGEDYE